MQPVNQPTSRFGFLKNMASTIYTKVAGVAGSIIDKVRGVNAPPDQAAPVERPSRASQALSAIDQEMDTMVTKQRLREAYKSFVANNEKAREKPLAPSTAPRVPPTKHEKERKALFAARLAMRNSTRTTAPPAPPPAAPAAPVPPPTPPVAPAIIGMDTYGSAPYTLDPRTGAPLTADARPRAERFVIGQDPRLFVNDIIAKYSGETGTRKPNAKEITRELDAAVQDFKVRATAAYNELMAVGIRDLGLTNPNIKYINAGIDIAIYDRNTLLGRWNPNTEAPAVGPASKPHRTNVINAAANDYFLYCMGVILEEIWGDIDTYYAANSKAKHNLSKEGKDKVDVTRRQYYTGSSNIMFVAIFTVYQKDETASAIRFAGYSYDKNSLLARVYNQCKEAIGTTTWHWMPKNTTACKVSCGWMALYVADSFPTGKFTKNIKDGTVGMDRMHKSWLCDYGSRIGYELTLDFAIELMNTRTTRRHGIISAWSEDYTNPEDDSFMDVTFKYKIVREAEESGEPFIPSLYLVLCDRHWFACDATFAQHMLENTHTMSRGCDKRWRRLAEDTEEELNDLVNDCSCINYYMCAKDLSKCKLNTWNLCINNHNAIHVRGTDKFVSALFKHSVKPYVRLRVINPVEFFGVELTADQVDVFLNECQFTYGRNPIEYRSYHSFATDYVSSCMHGFVGNSMTTTDTELVKFMRSALYGGVIECIHPGRYQQGCTIMDINQMYPSALQRARLPMAVSEFSVVNHTVQQIVENYEKGFDYVLAVNVILDVNERYYPPFPHRDTSPIAEDDERVYTMTKLGTSHKDSFRIVCTYSYIKQLFDAIAGFPDYGYVSVVPTEEPQVMYACNDSAKQYATMDSLINRCAQARANAEKEFKCMHKLLINTYTGMCQIDPANYSVSFTIGQADDDEGAACVPGAGKISSSYGVHSIIDITNDDNCKYIKRASPNSKFFILAIAKDTDKPIDKLRRMPWGVALLWQAKFDQWNGINKILAANPSAKLVYTAVDSAHFIGEVTDYAGIDSQTEIGKWKIECTPAEIEEACYVKSCTYALKHKDGNYTIKQSGVAGSDRNGYSDMLNRVKQNP